MMITPVVMIFQLRRRTITPISVVMKKERWRTSLAVTSSKCVRLEFSPIRFFRKRTPVSGTYRLRQASAPDARLAATSHQESAMAVCAASLIVITARLTATLSVTGVALAGSMLMAKSVLRLPCRSLVMKVKECQMKRLTSSSMIWRKV